MKTANTEPNITKLPKWAQEHISLLNRQKEYAERELKDYRNTQTKSRVFTGYFEQDRRYIQEDRVGFQLKHGVITVVVNEEYDELEIHGSYGSAEMAVFPNSSNVVKIKILPD